MKNKKLTIIYIAIACLVLLAVGVTIAYFSSESEFENEFKTGVYSIEATEEFESPQGWTPGTETPKTLEITNKGDLPVRVRVSYTEKWETNTDPATTLSLKKDGQDVAIINFDNTTDWTKIGNYYYYNNIITKNQKTTSFIKSVTFNPIVDLSVTCTSSNGGKTQTCSSAQDDYGNATYTLTIKVETIQADGASEVWGVNFD